MTRVSLDAVAGQILKIDHRLTIRSDLGRGRLGIHLAGVRKKAQTAYL